MEIRNIKEFEKASKKLQKDTLKIALALLFLIGAALLALIFGQANSKGLLLIFAVRDWGVYGDEYWCERCV